MSIWLHFEHSGERCFGALEDEQVRLYRGELFSDPEPTERTLPLGEVRTLTPCTPSKWIGLWNNYRAFAASLGQAIPTEPLYFIKGANSYCAHEQVIPAPAGYDGRVFYEGELGIVIGRTCKGVPIDEAEKYIFGFTCVNDVTANDLIGRDPAFQQWSRGKSLDGFGVFGPGIATGLDPASLTVRTRVNGRERQNYRAPT